MKRLTSYNMGFALQIFAVILLFGYPGYSSIKVQRELNTDKTGLIIEKTSAAANTANIKKPNDSLSLLHQRKQDVTKFSLVVWPRK